MGPVLALVVMLASDPNCGATPLEIHAATSSSILLHAHPRAWRPPSTVMVDGVRLDPDSGEPGAAAEERQMAQARRAALAQLPVQTRADGSRYMVLGGLVRSYMIATVTPDGRLVEACVHSPEEAAARVNAAPSPAAPAPRAPRREN